MKFGKALRRVIDQTFPAWQEFFIAYKDLKQQLNRIAAIRQQMPNPAETPARLIIAPAETAEEMRFVTLLYREISKLNAFFSEEEEEFVIRFQDLREKAVENHASRGGLLRIWRDLVCLHGEMILLENYSSINCLDREEARQAEQQRGAPPPPIRAEAIAAAILPDGAAVRAHRRVRADLARAGEIAAIRGG
ncbi:SPX domain-containing protein 5 isoform X2 [Selaginella moellendorffii]|uniref:SPX domain-containing protein 5 isoform X2 n=1 Tax=Selaginella moellendorffii TaxID=88036 RepID=UPI000D1CB058|nr:SPX domain-containing protein 5 isoform X2 [Selaginella moellendorffii]|eukprot:XP_024526142.1 SPX domain-containing protein 5 isoform X2 [Selaginella moellendorffii]